MEITNLKPTPTVPNYTPLKRNDAVKDLQPQSQNADVDPILHEQQVTDLSKVEKQRLDTVIQAANMFKNVYAVSDLKFTIFKDTSGQFVTRFTSLKDGSVTYVPEPNIIKFMESASERREALLEVKA